MKYLNVQTVIDISVLCCRHEVYESLWINEDEAVFVLHPLAAHVVHAAWSSVKAPGWHTCIHKHTHSATVL